MTLQEIKQVKEDILWDVTAEKNFKIHSISSIEDLILNPNSEKQGYLFYIRVDNQHPELIMAKLENEQCENICKIEMAEEVLEQALGESSSSSQVNGVYPCGETIKNILKAEINS